MLYLIFLFPIFFNILLKNNNDRSIEGVNIGGWLVLEPWITPSLFQRFLGKKKDEFAMDTQSFCEVLGPNRGNEIMKSHWDHWITEDHIKAVADRGIKMLRLPIGDWAIVAYGPQIGCTYGAKDRIKWLLDVAQKYGLQVQIDIHSIKNNANGSDNGGKCNKVTWTDEFHFEHTHAGEWLGTFDPVSREYAKLDNNGLLWAKSIVEIFLDNYKDHPALIAFQPVNEPQPESPAFIIKTFYREVRDLIRKRAPHLIFVFADQKKFNATFWNDLFPDSDMENIAIDTHKYFAFNHSPTFSTVNEYCDFLEDMMIPSYKIKYPIWVGEWAIGVDICPMWIEGINQNKTPYQFDCNRVDCPKSQLPEKYAVDFDRNSDILGPFSADRSNGTQIKFGTCQTNSLKFTEHENQLLSKCMQKVFDRYAQAQFYWNIRTEISIIYDFIKSKDLGYFSNPIKDKKLKNSNYKFQNV